MILYITYFVSKCVKCMKQLAVQTGFEPVVSSVTGKHVRPLHHWTVILIHFYLHHPCHALVDKHLNELV